ncbi:EAL domain-containing protein [Sulfurospirillum sp. T05]|uniref:EAL domain-containing protein n=1 Tax=Sulfurospirillum tamanense TaxID=2813362 RepID=A0ABS2WSA6_9BACT|nr:bifunctional diguanylate cyclase/phosphodiesterase [Sulfurospirillum tamanensis]MBN2964395.1 EAL domain-containing protein [Sulfurospirillum tamanensis]
MKTYHKVLLILFFVLVGLLSFKGYKDYVQIKSAYQMVALEESKTLANAIVAFRETYQSLFLDHNISINTTTAPLFPHKATELIAQKFQTLDGARKEARVYVPLKKALDEQVMDARAFEYFVAHPDEAHYFLPLSGHEYYYATPFFASALCVSCHKGERTYEEGALVGVVGIEGKNTRLITALQGDYFSSMVAYGVLGIMIYILLAYFVRKGYVRDEHYRVTLEKELKEHLEMLSQKSEEMHYQIFHDALTNLPNRNQLMQDLSTKEGSALALINIDDFKQINDFYGQEIGDEVLVSLGQLVLTFAKHHRAHAYKLHADEYAIMFPQIVPRVLEKKIHALLEELRQFILITDEDHDIDIMATIGAAIGDETLLAHADMALKKAKKERISYLLYESSMEIKEEYEKNIESSRRLKRAIRDDRIVPYYQAIVSLENKSAKRYEVLMRLIGEDGSEVAPNSFLHVAKKSRLYNQLTRIIITKSFEAMRPCDAVFSVNVSIMDILNPKTVAFILEKIDQFPEPARITFEILESEGIENYKDVLEFVRQVKAKGCSIAIDDFGSGYSSFEHILNLHVDVLKIDASLIRSIDTNKNARVTVETILSFAKALGIKTCAEFVYSKEIYDILEGMGVDYVQGYYLAKPLPFEKL